MNKLEEKVKTNFLGIRTKYYEAILNFVNTNSILYLNKCVFMINLHLSGSGAS